MSLKPFSTNEIANLRENFEKNGWHLQGTIQNFFRYSVSKDKIITFTIKFPVLLPVRLNIPFEVASFRVSMAFKFFELNQGVQTVVAILMQLLRSLALQVSMEHNFPIEGKERELVKILNVLIPDVINDENERAWLNRIRTSLMTKREQFKKWDVEKIKPIIEKLKSLGLEPTFKQPWELKKGLPKLRVSETLFFSNDEKFDEFFILEKGYYTYFKDLEYNKFYLRTSFESYSPYILNDIFVKDQNFKLETFVENWIKFARLILNSLIEIINSAEITQLDFMNLKPEKDLDSDSFEQTQNNFSFSALHYEGKVTKELYSIHNDLLSKPPTDFEIIEKINYYTEAEELIKNYRFDEATKLLTESLKIFNKYLQKKAVVSALMLLRKIASLLNEDNVAINYLQSALGVAKSGEIPIDFIIKIHYKLGKIYFRAKAYDKAETHFTIIVNFLEKESGSMEQNEEKAKKSEFAFNRDDYLGMAYLFLGLIALENEKISDSRDFFKKSFQLAANSLKVKLNYFLQRALYFKNKNDFSRMQKVLRISISSLDINNIDEKSRNLMCDVLLELAEFYIHYHKDSKRATYLLSKVETYVSTKMKTIPGMRRAIRYNLLMSDYYNFLERNSENNQYYLKQGRTLKAQLKAFGVNE